MQESQLVSWIMIGIGIITAVRNLRYWRHPALLRDYIERSPKAWLWRKFLGAERTVVLAKKVFLPLGMVVAITFVGVGAYQLLA